MKLTAIRHGSCPALDDEGFGDFRTMAQRRSDAVRGSRKLRKALLRLAPPSRRKCVRVRKSYGTWEERKARMAQIERLQRIVADHFGIPAETMTARRGPQKIAEKRQVAMYLARVVVRSSYPDIGASFGHKDHTTIIHACREVEASPHLAADIEALRGALLP